MVVYTDEDFERHVYEAGFYIPKDGKLVPVFGDAARLEANRLAAELHTSPNYVAGACIGGRYTMMGPDFARYENHDQPERPAVENLKATYSSLDDALHAFKLYRSVADDPDADGIYDEMLSMWDAVRKKVREMDKVQPIDINDDTSGGESYEQICQRGFYYPDDDGILHKTEGANDATTIAEKLGETHGMT